MVILSNRDNGILRGTRAYSRKGTSAWRSASLQVDYRQNAPMCKPSGLIGSGGLGRPLHDGGFAVLSSPSPAQAPPGKPRQRRVDTFVRQPGRWPAVNVA